MNARSDVDALSTIMHFADPLVTLFQTLGLLLGLPGFLFAFACLVLKRATARGSLFGFLDTILRFIVVMLPWGCIVMGTLLVLLAVAGCSAEWHRVVSGVILAAATGSAVVMHRVGRLRDADQGWFYVPGLLSAAISGWLLFAAS